MLIKLTDKNKEAILVETANIVNCIKNGNGLNGIKTKILLANVDRAESAMFVWESADEIYDIERRALKDYAIVNNYVVKMPETKKDQTEIKVVVPENIDKTIKEKLAEKKQ